MKVPATAASLTGLLFPSPPPVVPARPFIKWAGGKRQLLPELLRFVPARYGTYFEPFAGGAALFFSIAPAKAILCDLNERLVRTYRGVAAEVERVISLLSAWPHDRDFFLEMRRADTASMDDAALAAWFIYLNRTAFNGLYRVNRKDQFNVPFGRYTNPTICDPETLRQASVALRRCARIDVADFEESVSSAVSGDFVYFDPPYVPVSANSNFARYTSDVFAVPDQRRLRDVALSLKRRGVTVLLSNSAAPLVHELYRDDFEIHSVSVRRAVSGRAEGRGAITEVVIR